VVPGRSWRPFAAPAVFLLVATLAVLGIRALVASPSSRSSGKAPPRTQPAAQERAKPKAPAARRYWVVRAGDTLAVVAARTGVPMARLLALNPNLQPTALFIGQRIRLR
jgi:LysM repeat protein